MLWLVYVYDLFVNSPGGIVWGAIYVACGILFVVIPLLALFTLLFNWKELTAKQRLHLMIAVVFY